MLLHSVGVLEIRRMTICLYNRRVIYVISYPSLADSKERSSEPIIDE